VANLDTTTKNNRLDAVQGMGSSHLGEANLLEVDDVAIAFDTQKGRFNAVDGISFAIRPGKTHAIVGESGCGKSVTALATMDLLPENGHIVRGDIRLHGKSLMQMSKTERRKLRGSEIAMIFQEPMTALNPVFTVGQQIIEVFKIHRKLSTAEARREAIKMLEKVRISDPEIRIDEYPFQMSGGMRQRVLIAIALACNPKLLIADEPTTALDVTIQHQILVLMRELQKDLGTAIILITHDLGVVAEMADDVTVMYAGKVVETGTVFDIFDRPTHPYTLGLLASIPKVTDTKDTKLQSIKGMVPSIYDRGTGCRFNSRCPLVEDKCYSENPTLKKLAGVHQAACHRMSSKEKV
jgi:oligopeptide/dipeptide ABC transporter ATP-binding protein